MSSYPLDQQSELEVTERMLVQVAAAFKTARKELKKLHKTGKPRVRGKIILGANSSTLQKIKTLDARLSAHTSEMHSLGARRDITRRAGYRRFLAAIESAKLKS